MNNIITIKEFREKRINFALNRVTTGEMKLMFKLLFIQWLDNNTKFTNAEIAAHSNEARAYRELIGITAANAIMDEVTSERLLNATQEVLGEIK